MINNRQGDSLETTNSGINHCSWYAKKKAYRSGTQQLEFNFNGSNGSHNIYYIKSNCLGRLLQKSDVSKTSGKPGKSISLNTFGQTDILKVYVQSIKSYYKDLYSNVWIELVGKNPILLRNSINEIENKIIRSR
jgi:hypothetical protein